MAVSRWDVVRFDFGAPLADGTAAAQVGHEQWGRRPALIVSTDHMNHSAAEMVTVCPFTSTVRQLRPSEVGFPVVGGLETPSILLVHQVRSASTNRIVALLGTIEDPVLRREVEEQIRRHFSLSGPAA